MEQTFEYLKVQTAMDSINVENVGNVILQANNDNEFYWYIAISTDAGFTMIKEFGPVFKNSELSKMGFNYNIQRIEYNEKALCKRISNFLNDGKRAITQVMQIDEFDLEEKISQIKDIL